MKLSNRLSAIAEMVPKCDCIADIGTDHGYLPIELVKAGVVKKAYAMDINKGPLETAKTNIEKAGLQKEISLILSDGLKNIPEDVNVIVVAGMGGMLIGEILMAHREKLKDVEQLIVSPHLDGEALRRKVHNLGYRIEEETVIKDQGKFYPIIKCGIGDECYTDVEYRYGKPLIISNKVVYREYLMVLKKRCSEVINRLDHLQSSHAVEQKLEALKEELKEIDEVLSYE